RGHPVRRGGSPAVHQGDLVPASVRLGRAASARFPLCGAAPMLIGSVGTIPEALRGWSGLAWDFAAVQGSTWMAMARGRAQWRAYAASPAVAGALMIATGVGLSLASPLVHSMHIAAGGLTEYVLGAGVCGLLGYGGGRVLAAPSRSTEDHIRGTTVFDAEEVAAEHGRRHASGRARGASAEGRQGGITLAGVPVPASD